MSDRPSTRAPPRVAISSASRAPIAAGPSRSRATSIACRASSPRWLLSFDADPSTPSPTGTPASRIARTGAMPLASRALEQGQCATPVPVRANSAISSGDNFTQWACHTSSPVQPTLSA